MGGVVVVFGGDVFPLDGVWGDGFTGGVYFGGGEFYFDGVFAGFLEVDEWAAVGEGGAKVVGVFFPEGGDGPV